MTPCAVDGCSGTVAIKTRTLCPPHFQRWLAGLPMDAPTADMRGIPIQERFWRRVNKTPTCWLWTGPLFDGYGRIKRGRTALPIHRFAYTLLVGPIPDGYQIDHKCRVRHCVRPDHLQAVPQALNAQNRSNKGRGKSGVRGVIWCTKLEVWHVRCGDGQGGKVHGGTFRDLAEAEAAAIALRNRIMTNNLEDRREVA